MPQANFDFSVYIAERTRAFVGREWVFAEIDRWLAEPDSPQIFIVTGEPGIGKTAIAARLTQFSNGTQSPPTDYTHVGSGFLSAVHFCSARNGGWISPDGFARSLSAQLTARYPPFADALASDPHIHIEQKAETVSGTMIGAQITNYYAETSKALFNNLVRMPLQALCREDWFSGLLVILVDGLDEALSYSGRVNIVRLLVACYDLPSQVRLLLTSRPVDGVLESFRSLEPFILFAHSEKNQSDVLAYVRQRFETSAALEDQVRDEAQAERVASSVVARSGGNFLVISKVLDGIEQGELSLDDPRELPAELQDLYAWFLDRLTQGNVEVWRRLYRPVLGILAVAQEAVDMSALCWWTSLPRQQVIDALHDLREFLDLVLDGRYRIYHESVIDFLTGDRAEPYFLDAAEYHRQIAASYIRRYTEDGQAWSDCGHYGLNYLLVHLVEAGQIEILHLLLSDLDWLQVKLNTVGVKALIDDYEKSLSAMQEEKQGALEIWKALFLEKAHLLIQGDKHWPANRILLQLAVEYADDSPVTQTAEAWLQRGTCDWVWLRRRERARRTISLDTVPLTFLGVAKWSWITDRVMEVWTGREKIELDFSSRIRLTRSERIEAQSTTLEARSESCQIEVTSNREGEFIDLLGQFRWQHHAENQFGQRADVWIYRGECVMECGLRVNGEPSYYERTVVSPTADALAIVNSDGCHRIFRICSPAGDLQSEWVVLSPTENVVAVGPRGRYLIYSDEYGYDLHIRAIPWDSMTRLTDISRFATRRWWTFEPSRNVAIIETNEGIVSLHADRETATMDWLAANDEQVYGLGGWRVVEWEVVHCHGDDVGVACIIHKEYRQYEKCELVWRLWSESGWSRASIEWSTWVVGVKQCQLVPDGTIQVEFENYYEDEYEVGEGESSSWYRFLPGGKAFPISRPQGQADGALKHRVHEQDMFLQLEVSGQERARWFGSKGLVWIRPRSDNDSRIAAWVLNPSDGWEPFPLVWVQG